MSYFMIITAALLFSFQFVFNDGYQKENGSNWNASLKFALYSSVTGLIILFIINKFHIELNLFSTVVATIYSIVCIALGYSSIKAFQYANLSVYSVFSMIGGMLLPFIYGIISGEELKTSRVVCCLLIAVSVFISGTTNRHSEKAVKYYISVFILNGLVGVISKFHQSCTELCVDSGSFMMLTKLATILFSVVLLSLQKNRSFFINKKSCMYSVLYAILNSVGNLLLLIALIELPASIQYPVITGGVIIFSTAIVLMRREKITKKEITAAGIAFVATVFMAL